jgi:hypothetical protein
MSDEKSVRMEIDAQKIDWASEEISRISKKVQRFLCYFVGLTVW